MSKEYNGWTNYETWWVNLHYFDGMTGLDTDSAKDFVEESIENEAEGLPAEMAKAFITDVDWEEIADAMEDDEDDY